MPALVNSRLGEVGIREADGTMLCCFSWKKSRKDWRIFFEVMVKKLDKADAPPEASIISPHWLLGKEQWWRRLQLMTYAVEQSSSAKADATKVCGIAIMRRRCYTLLMKTLTVKVSDPLLAEIEAAARERKVSKSEIVRERLEQGQKQSGASLWGRLRIWSLMMSRLPRIFPQISNFRKLWFKAC